MNNFKFEFNVSVFVVFFHKIIKAEFMNRKITIENFYIKQVHVH